MFVVLVGGFIVVSLIGWKIVHNAQQFDKKKPRVKKRA